MPTVILLDVSLSMCRNVTVNDGNESQTCQVKSLANHGINALLDYQLQHCKLEFTSLMVFSSLWQILCKFTRDYESIKNELQNIELFDKTKFINALRGVKNMVVDEWGTEMSCQVILITDGNAAVNAMLMNSNAGHSADELYEEDTRVENWPLPFPFPSKLHVVCLSTLNDPLLQSSLKFFRKLVELNGSNNISDAHSGGQIWIPEGSVLSFKSVQQLFIKLAESNYRPFRGTLRSGSLSSPIALYPSPENYVQINDFETIKAELSNEINICGFMEISEVASPPVYSRHLVLPLPESKEEVKKYVSVLTQNSSNESETPSVDIEELVNSLCSDEGRQPSFCVLLHGSLKVEGMVAICQVGNPDWYGMLYSWADSKKKSNLMLSTFKCGAEVIQWIGSFKLLGFPSLSIQQTQSASDKANAKKNFSQNSVVWLKQAGLQSDIQKILRHARKLPEKTLNFYKELNRIRRAALSFGFYSLIDGLASILERECRMLSGTAHPEAALQLTHAASCLRQPFNEDSYNQLITPLETKFNIS